MDQRWADGTSHGNVRARRRTLRAGVRAQRRAADAVPDRFQTPQWLERSFVLPLSDGEVTVVPSQPQPHHDDYPGAPSVQNHARDAEVDPTAAPTYVRPPSEEIDFARIIKRSDLCRTANRAAIASIGFAGLALVAFLVTMDPAGLLVAIAFAVMAVVAAGVRVKLATAPVPHLER